MSRRLPPKQMLRRPQQALVRARSPPPAGLRHRHCCRSCRSYRLAIVPRPPPAQALAHRGRSHLRPSNSGDSSSSSTEAAAASGAAGSAAAPSSADAMSSAAASSAVASSSAGATAACCPPSAPTSLSVVPVVPACDCAPSAVCAVGAVSASVESGSVAVATVESDDVSSAGAPVSPVAAAVVVSSVVSSVVSVGRLDRGLGRAVGDVDGLPGLPALPGVRPAGQEHAEQDPDDHEGAGGRGRDSQRLAPLERGDRAAGSVANVVHAVCSFVIGASRYTSRLSRDSTPRPAPHQSSPNDRAAGAGAVVLTGLRIAGNPMR